MLNTLGEYKIYTSSVTGEDLYKYVGLTCVGCSVKATLFDSAECANSYTNEVLKCAMSADIKEKYGNKKFRVKVKGKYVESNKSIEWKKEFNGYVDMVLSTLSLDNFVDSLNFLADVYEEIVRDVAA